MSERVFYHLALNLDLWVYISEHQIGFSALVFGVDCCPGDAADAITLIRVIR